MVRSAVHAPAQLLCFALSLAPLCACGSDEPTAAMGQEIREFDELLTGEAQLERLCGRPESDLVIDAFCGSSPASVGGLMDLRRAVELGDNENGIDQGYAATGHSTSLSSHGVSAINPRIIFSRLEGMDEAIELVSLAYTRGERFAEIVVRSRLDAELQFYLVQFTLPCDAQSAGCQPGDLLTEVAESDWQELSVYAEEDLINTPLDCRVCHQPEGPGSQKLLRMQEFRPPWNHWLWRHSEGGRALLADYFAARGDEPLAGVPGPEIETSQPGLLSAIVFFSGSEVQPNEFQSDRIEREVMDSAAKRGGDQPSDNSVPGESETWQAIYEQAKLGNAIAVPYHDVKVTDADKLALMTEAYTDYREGRLARADLPDIRQVYPDDRELLARMGFTTEPGLDGQGVLLQACGQCHNSRMDQTLSRSRFDVDLSRVDDDVRARAIARVKLPPDDPAVMPPVRFRALDDEARDALIELLDR